MLNINTGRTRQDAASSNIGSTPHLINPAEAPGILGISTGQGAQWATMGRELAVASPFFRRSIEA
ncbi:Putative Acyl transferase domain superfamily, Acyl transferase/acyl hydrolase/lysophospholipase [Colletotrichum destructivum]|uniref:Acyl transferase domain superfamily, Acyl transferase/acyl hydrolase/lysophospholipase n=1 Tax=Colletotrichum destructivum TaxID=34406 RepID=A0AAX4J3S5_9PEZI|nr:Putative Acyl transferase domain superfamily, Acyl transferase/acyl hydrolase/lysophospholipase [Colletotrichum destructivum]